MKRTIPALGVAAALLATSATASADPGRGHRGGYNPGGVNRGGFGYAPGYGGDRPPSAYAAPYRAYGPPGYGYTSPYRYGRGYGYGSQPGFSLGVARPGLSFGFNLFR